MSCLCTDTSGTTNTDSDILFTGDCAISGVSWCEILTPAFRAFVGDLVEPYKYSNNRACQLMEAAAFYLAADLCDCPTLSITIDVCSSSVTPNPLESATIANLIVLKAVCMADLGDVRTKAITAGIKAVCGPATLQTMNASANFNLLLEEGACSAYKDLKENCCYKSVLQSADNCRIVLGAFVAPYYMPCNQQVVTDECDSPVNYTRTGGAGSCCT